MSGVALGVAVLFAGLATNAGISAVDRPDRRDLVGRADLRVEAFGETGLRRTTLAADRRDARASPSPRPRSSGGPISARTARSGRRAAAAGHRRSASTRPPRPQVHDLPSRAGAPLDGPDAPSALVSASARPRGRAASAAPITFQGPDGPPSPAGRRHPGRRRPVGRRGGPDGRAAARHRSGGLRRPTVSRVDIGLGPGRHAGRGDRRAGGRADRPALRAVGAGRPRAPRCARRPPTSPRRPP